MTVEEFDNKAYQLGIDLVNENITQEQYQREMMILEEEYFRGLS